MKISLLRVAAFGSVVALSACGRPGQPRPAPRETPIVTTAVPRAEDDPTASSTASSTFPSDDEVEVPKTPEEIRHQKAETIVAEKDLPAEMSRDDMLRLINETEKQLPLEPETKSPKVETTTSKTELPNFTFPDIPRAKVDATMVKKPIIPSPKPDPKKTSTDSWAWPTMPPKKTDPTTTPKTTPSPIPPVKAEPKTTDPGTKKEEPKKEKPDQTVEKNVDSDLDPSAANDNGVDAEDEKFEEEYAGPKTVVDHPRSTAEFQLSEVAAQLGAMARAKYLGLQKNTIGTKVKSCNFFFVVALIEAKGPDAKGRVATPKNYPGSMAAQLDTTYFQPAGWERISLEDLKQWFREGRVFDVAIHRDAPKGKKHGHVAIPIGLNADGNVMVAEASYLSVSNRIAVYSDSSLKSKFKIFARWAK